MKVTNLMENEVTRTAFTPDQFELLGHLLYVATSPSWTIEQRIKYCKKIIREHNISAKDTKTPTKTD